MACSVSRWSEALLAALLWCPGPAGAQPATYYVAPDGSDASGDGSSARPWATLAGAAARIPDNGSTVVARDGVYSGRVRLNRRFLERAAFRAENPYRARLEHAASNESVVTVFGGANFELAGFEITRPSPDATGALLMQVQQSGGLVAEDVVIRDNIFRDSFNNDLLKINNQARRVLVEGNLFYNQQGSDEHIDVNGVTDVTIRDNVFFNDFAGSARANRNDTSSFIVIKNSAALPESRRIRVHRNVFLNWEGSPGSNFVLIGEDGQPFHEAEEVLVENNLMIGNSSNRMRAPFGVKGGKTITFRNNTIAGDLPANAFAMRLNREGRNPVNEQILFFNNIWSDPTGTMEDFADGEPAETAGAELDNNLYWNGGQPVPTGPDVLNYTDDRRRILADPRLGVQAGLLLPRWTGERFLSGNRTIRQEFERLVMLYGALAAGSAAIGRSDPPRAPLDDILGRRRDTEPDLGAFEANTRLPEPRAAVDAAAFRPPLAPGGLATLFGENLADVTAFAAALPLPVSLAGVSVLVEGRAAPLLYISPGQINFQLPYETPGAGTFTVVRTGFSSRAASYAAAPTAPAIFAGGIVHASTGRPVTPSEPARAGQFVSVYATGLGALAPPGVPTGQAASGPAPVVAPVRVRFNAASVTPSYAGLAVGYAGLYQVNVQVPSGLSGPVQVELDAAGVLSSGVLIVVTP